MFSNKIVGHTGIEDDNDDDDDDDQIKIERKMVIECLDYHGKIKSALDLDKLNEKCKYLHVDRVKARFKINTWNFSFENNADDKMK